MVRYTLLTLLSALMLITACAKKPIPAETKQTFEGVVEYKLNYPEGTNPAQEGLPEKMFATIRGEKMMMAFKIGEQKFKIINDRERRHITSISYIDKRFYATISDSSSSVVGGITKVECTETEKLKKIAKHRCIKVEAKATHRGQEYNYDVYYTPELANVNYYWSYGYSQINGVLLKFTIFDFGVPVELEAVAVTPKSIDPFIFTLPPGTIIKH